jgi:hypothetical protein
MRQVMYLMEYEGTAAPRADDPSTLDVRCAGKSIAPSGGKHTAARYESVVSMNSETTFEESTTITFEEGGRLFLTSVGHGYIAPRADGRAAGGVVWLVTGGDGPFAEASGVVSSSFSVGDRGDVIDYHAGVIVVP